MFEVRKNVPLPVSQPSANRLPFPWDTMELGDSFFVPHSFWSDRVEEGTKVDFKLARDRIRNAFATWKKAKEADRKHLQVLLTEEEATGPNDAPDAPDKIKGTGVFLTTVTGDIKAAA